MYIRERFLQSIKLMEDLRRAIYVGLSGILGGKVQCLCWEVGSKSMDWSIKVIEEN